MSNPPNQEQSTEAHMAIIGLGYVGLPLAIQFAKSGLFVTSIDIDAKHFKNPTYS